jgi:ADP-heptose:LPS heptosyltransferase
VLARTPRLTHLGDALADFDDTAAVVTLADLVISVDTSVVHLAGALGRPTWVLVPFCPDWRWGLTGESSPWYPAARLFRQPAPGDWDGVLARMGEELTRL